MLLIISPILFEVISLIGRPELEQAAHQLLALRRAVDEHQLTGHGLPHHHHLMHLHPAQPKRHSGVGESNRG